MLAGKRYALTRAAVITISIITTVTLGNLARADQVREAEWPLNAFHAEKSVWSRSTGRSVVVAVIDQGVRASHQDLNRAVLPGKCFYAPCSPWIDTSVDGHGTAMASLVAGRGHGNSDGEGVVGLAPATRILPLAVNLSSGSNGTQITQAIRFAVDSGASVINMSFGGLTSTDEVQLGVRYAESRDAVIVASAGNFRSPKIEWPAAYPGVVAVGAVDVNGRVWEQSNYGPGLTLVAPGVNIVAAGANSDSEYRLSDGTSDAAAYVSAEAALVRAEYPGLTAGQVVNRMIKSAVNPTGKVHDDHYGYGIIRPDAALTFDIPPGPPEGPLRQVDEAASPSGGAGPVGAVTASGGGRGHGGGGVAVAVGVGAGVVVGVGGLGWMWWRRRKAVG
ncbi:S8 family serine peptidase [Streptacidiphilus jiangxiensis]|uniref:Type VII secretion-associated serine protease mycosin n=1 Tax=Streptacidiphilus jiangxiensis TaxID=235985 RepID=A0A1H7LST3_STRJI|nr:S8 family serine peptidase [Streptacidiphilus jiangxiensis]SEL01417.1 type VII secretion-associated serine protease mycosin [Streptacidiphilus jiangxiensis]